MPRPGDVVQPAARIEADRRIDTLPLVPGPFFGPSEVAGTPDLSLRGPQPLVRVVGVGLEGWRRDE